MKATDLMLGDMLTINGSLYPHKVLAIRDTRYCPHNNATITTTYCDNWMSQDEYEPIPLTAEILEKNGYVKIILSTHFYNEEYDALLYIKKGTKGFFTQCLGKNTQIDYVHELQHALRLCGLNELADNFKV